MLLIIELWQSLPCPLRPTLLATSGRLECKSAEQSAVCFEPVGMSPSPFSIRVPCTHSLCRMLTLRRGFYLRSIVRCVLNLLESVSSCIALLDSDLSSGRSLRSLFAHAHWAVRASPSTCLLCLRGRELICTLCEVCHYRGDQLVGRYLLMRSRCSVSIAPVLSDICSADLGDSAGCSLDLTMLLASLDQISGIRATLESLWFPLRMRRLFSVGVCFAWAGPVSCP